MIPLTLKVEKRLWRKGEARKMDGAPVDVWHDVTPAAREMTMDDWYAYHGRMLTDAQVLGGAR